MLWKISIDDKMSGFVNTVVAYYLNAYFKND